MLTLVRRWQIGYKAMGMGKPSNIIITLPLVAACSLLQPLSIINFLSFVVRQEGKTFESWIHH